MFRAISSRAEIKMLSLRIAIKIRQIFDAIFFDDHVISENCGYRFTTSLHISRQKKAMAQQTITSSNSTIETLKKDKKICSKLKLMKPEHQ